MPSLIVIGPLNTATLPLLSTLTQAGYQLTLTQTLPTSTATPLFVVLSDPIPNLAELKTLNPPPRWIAWNQTDDSSLTLQAYQAGAAAVLPAATTPELFLQTIQTLTASPAQPVSAQQPRHYRYHRGDLILPETDAVIEVQEGVVALSVVHHDGAQVLLGLCGPGQTLIGHPHDTCSLQLVAHTDSAVTFRSWAEAARSPDFNERLRSRLQHLEAWAAMQARPHLDQRIMGLLSLLADQFGQPHEQGTLINTRITHVQLASAVGTTRSTITRTLGDLKARGLLGLVGSGDSERFCLYAIEQGHHSHQH
jgi:CRP-like cAMP-binding protein